MKRILSLLFAVLMVFSLTACGNNGIPAEKQEEAKAPDLTGEWKQVNPNSEDNYHIATIGGDQIEIYWFTASTDTKSLYWAGTFVAPTTTDTPYTWDSQNDKEKTGSAMLASGDDTKTFTYDGKQISYSASALGITQTVKLEKQ